MTHCISDATYNINKSEDGFLKQLIIEHKMLYIKQRSNSLEPVQLEKFLELVRWCRVGTSSPL